MRIAVAADEVTRVAEAVVEGLRARGHEVVAHGALSLRTLSGAVLEEILDAWFAAEPSQDAADVANVEHLSALEQSAERG